MITTNRDRVLMSRQGTLSFHWLGSLSRLALLGIHVASAGTALAVSGALVASPDTRLALSAHAPRRYSTVAAVSIHGAFGSEDFATFTIAAFDLRIVQGATAVRAGKALVLDCNAKRSRRVNHQVLDHSLVMMKTSSIISEFVCWPMFRRNGRGHSQSPPHAPIYLVLMF